MVDHFARVLGGGIHGGAAGGQLTGHALAHGTINDTGHILGNDGAEHFLAAGLVQNLAAAGLGLLLLGGLDAQGQHLHGGSRLGHHGVEPGVAEFHCVVIALQVALGDLPGEGKALTHRDIRRQQHLFGEQIGPVVGKVLLASFANGQHRDRALLGLRLLEHVGVISTGKSAIGRNDDNCLFLRIPAL